VVAARVQDDGSGDDDDNIKKKRKGSDVANSPRKGCERWVWWNSRNRGVVRVGSHVCGGGKVPKSWVIVVALCLNVDVGHVFVVFVF
jgi:hypothetical protein